MNGNDKKIIIFITASSKEEAENIGRALVNERLAACCNIVDNISSIFRWEGKICRENEVLLLVKSSSSLFGDIVKKVKSIHSYDVPEVIAVPIKCGSEEYLNWIENEIKEQEKINMSNKSNKALIIIDMLKDFIEKDGALYCGDKARNIIPFVQKRIEEIRNTGGTVIFLQDNHSEDDLEFKVYPKHCVRGTKGAEIIDEIEVKEDDIVIPKTRYSGFYSTELEQVLEEKEIGEVEVVGVCTSICVMDTVGDLRNRDYSVTVWRDGVADFDNEAHQFSLKRMEKIYGAKVI